MIFIVGGAYQGKRKYAEKYADSMTDGAECTYSELFESRCIYNYHELVKRMLNENIEPVEFTERLCKDNPNLVVVMNEIGCGIIPLEKSERIWREAAGRCGCVIAEKSDTVIRVTCGISDIIKGEQT